MVTVATPAPRQCPTTIVLHVYNLKERMKRKNRVKVREIRVGRRKRKTLEGRMDARMDGWGLIDGKKDEWKEAGICQNLLKISMKEINKELQLIYNCHFRIYLTSLPIFLIFIFLFSPLSNI